MRAMCPNFSVDFLPGWGDITAHVEGEEPGE